MAPLRRDDAELSVDELLTALEAGDVVLLYRDDALRPALRRLQEDIAGAFDPAVARAGQAVVLARGKPAGGAAITALAWRHSLEVSSVDDPQLREFAEFWLGRGASGG